MNALIGNKKLIPSNVSKVPLQFSKSVNFNGYFYEFNKMLENTYPLELGLSQISAIKKYDLVFIEDSTNSLFFGVFLKNPTRKTIQIEKIYFSIQLNRYREHFNSIAIINNTEVLENTINFEELDNVDFVAIEKIPDLIDPNKKNQIFKFYAFGLLLIVLTLFSANTQISFHNDDLTLVKEQLNSEININAELLAKTRKNMLPTLPTKDVQNSQLSQYLTQIDNGSFK